MSKGKASRNHVRKVRLESTLIFLQRLNKEFNQQRVLEPHSSDIVSNDWQISNFRTFPCYWWPWATTAWSNFSLARTWRPNPVRPSTSPKLSSSSQNLSTKHRGRPKQDITGTCWYVSMASFLEWNKRPFKTFQEEWTHVILTITIYYPPGN